MAEADATEHDARFPARRLRRLRRTPALRRLVAEARLGVDDLVAPLFVREGIDVPTPIASMPGEVQHTVDSLVLEAKRLAALGLPGLILFGVPAHKDAQGSGAWDPEGIVQVALRAVRDAVGDELVVMADLCLDEYTDHGHCGVLGPGGEVLNDPTLELYQRVALAQAEAGADVVAPSGMMDGQVAAIRAALDGDGHEEVAILAYAAKYASALYGPFRDAVDVTITGGGDRRAYQQDPRNQREALAEIALDVAEGADMVMVKPAMTSLDILAAARGAVDVPLAAYHVSGEFAMVRAAAAAGWIDGAAVALEQLTVLKRAGADFVLTYFAAEVAEAIGG
jgi:porphobilinogen synthase